MWLFHLNMNIEGRVWRQAVTSGWSQQRQQYFFDENLWLSFHIWCQIKAISKNSKFFKFDEILRTQTLFRGKCHRKLTGYLNSQAHSLHFELLIDPLLAKIKFWQVIKIAKRIVEHHVCFFHRICFLYVWKSLKVFICIYDISSFHHSGVWNIVNLIIS